MALAVVVLSIVALLKRIETRLVLFTAGMVMALLSLEPMAALNAFAANMTKGGLITAICSSMGFAAVISITRCDVHLVSLLLKPLGKIGFWLLPVRPSSVLFLRQRFLRDPVTTCSLSNWQIWMSWI